MYGDSNVGTGPTYHACAVFLGFCPLQLAATKCPCDLYPTPIWVFLGNAPNITKNYIIKKNIIRLILD
jgi:hypothetical protein